MRCVCTSHTDTSHAPPHLHRPTDLTYTTHVHNSHAHTHTHTTHMHHTHTHTYTHSHIHIVNKIKYRGTFFCFLPKVFVNYMLSKDCFPLSLWSFLRPSNPECATNLPSPDQPLCNPSCVLNCHTTAKGNSHTSAFELPPIQETITSASVHVFKMCHPDAWTTEATHVCINPYAPFQLTYQLLPSICTLLGIHTTKIFPLQDAGKW